jgi:hypothetical protein
LPERRAIAGHRIALTKVAGGIHVLHRRSRKSGSGEKNPCRVLGPLPVAVLAILAFASIGMEWAGGQTCPDRLFIVARSKNANIVAYDANRGPGGELVSSEPVVAYWLLDGDPGRREELTRFQRERAYGVEGKPGHDSGTYTVVFKAARKRHLTVRLVDGCLVATTRIGGHTGILRRLFVKSKEGMGLPKVEYVEFFGEDPESKKPLYEKIVP